MPPRPRSGLQKEVLALYKRGLKNVKSKPTDVQEEFLLHLRYNFRHPKLTTRDHSAIEYQIRRFTRTLETLEEPSATRIRVSEVMWNWWDREVEKCGGLLKKEGLGGGGGG